MARFAWALIALLSVYLPLVLARGFVPALANPAYAWAFPVWAVLAALGLLCLLLMVPRAVTDVAELAALGSNTVFVAWMLACALVIGGLSLWSHSQRAPEMETRYCDRLTARLSTGIAEDAGRLSRWLAEKRGKKAGEITLCLERRAAQAAPASN